MYSLVPRLSSPRFYLTAVETNPEVNSPIFSTEINLGKESLGIYKASYVYTVLYVH